MLVLAEGLANQTLHPVARHGRAEHAGGDSEPQACMGALIMHGRNDEQDIGKAPAGFFDGAELGRLGQALARLEPEQREGPCAARLDNPRGYGQSRLRPLARRLANTRRPPFVAMRARNPCVRLRCRLLGLKVRFMTLARK